ncbi:hypothetical protein [Salibaculum griseiflavum]|uniref:Uncharacterized protein n=1 Tax=Salibaculum griseiflavum TaxID=1914409 RepID=A0A2V1NZH5_9RHOB|nr:hypothetical protein [Salibaculum griseiflavum]PWG15595.1 hypothetical protein DFK10_16045 [Salibaculum griseiflavum]
MANTYKQKLATEIEALSSRREQWENDQLKAANEKLYEILADCFTLMNDVMRKDSNAKALNSLLTDLGMKPKNNTSIALRVIRAVFGKEGKREHAYARVLKVAALEIAEDQSLASFIQERGGIEEIRRTPSASKKNLSSEDYKTIAKSVFAETPNTVSAYQLPETVKFTDADKQFAVAVLRIDENAQAHVLHSTTHEKLVNTALSVAGKEIHDLQESADTTAEHDEYINTLTSVLTKFHASLTFDPAQSEAPASTDEAAANVTLEES